jgi:epoxyqueuosine reductase
MKLRLYAASKKNPLSSIEYSSRVFCIHVHIPSGSAAVINNFMVKASTTTWISERAMELGFATAGIVRAGKFPELARQQEWLARGYAGEMKYLSDARRSDPQAALPGIQSVIVCALPYNTEHPRTEQAFAELDEATATGGPRGWISRYAWGDDYHEVLREKLQMLLDGLREQHRQPFEARIYADTGPINERVLAKHAGLGWLGKNTLLLNERIGSCFFLGVILTTLDLPSTSTSDAPPADRCGTCRKCIDACPTEALVEPYVMDARKCISYLTIELRGAIAEQLREPMAQHIFGCDICQDVCPWNRHAPVTGAKEFQPRSFAHPTPPAAREEKEFSLGGKNGAAPETLFLPRLERLASLSQSEFSAMFRGSPIKRTKWQGLIRNVCVALGNSNFNGDLAAFKRISSVLTRLAASPDPVISESAQWAVSRIQANETSPIVKMM